MHLHISRGKRSIVLDLRTDEGRAVFLELVARRRRGDRGHAPGRARQARASATRRCLEVNPRIVFCTISGYGMTGPTRTCRATASPTTCGPGSWQPEITEDGFCAIPEHPSIGIHAGPLFGALGVLAGITRARATGEPLPARDRPVRRGRGHGLAPQRDLEGLRAARDRGHRQQGRRLRAPGARHRRHARRRALPVLRDGRRPRPVHGVRARVLGELLRRHRPPRPVRAAPRLAVRRPRPRQHRAARRAGATIFRDPHHRRVDRPRRPRPTRRSRRSTRPRRWPTTRSSRTACRGSRRSGWARAGAVADQGGRRGAPAAHQGPDVGEHTDEVLREVLGYDDDRIAPPGGRRARAERRGDPSRCTSSDRGALSTELERRGAEEEQPGSEHRDGDDVHARARERRDDGRCVEHRLRRRRARGGGRCATGTLVVRACWSSARRGRCVVVGARRWSWSSAGSCVVVVVGGTVVVVVGGGAARDADAWTAATEGRATRCAGRVVGAHASRPRRGREGARPDRQGEADRASERAGRAIGAGGDRALGERAAGARLERHRQPGDGAAGHVDHGHDDGCDGVGRRVAPTRTRQGERPAEVGMADPVRLEPPRLRQHQRLGACRSPARPSDREPVDVEPA